MGLFDTLTCKYKLPLPENMGELNEAYFAADVPWQTKDLDCGMNIYAIDEEGILHVEKHEGHWTKGDPKAKNVRDRIGYYTRTKTWMERTNHTGVVNFYDSVYKKEFKNDYWLEYQAIFTNGKITNIKLHEFKAESNGGRREAEATWDKYHELEENFRNTLFYRFFYKYYMGVVRLIVRGAHRISNWLSYCYCVERKLDFMSNRLKNKSGVTALIKKNETAI